MQKLDKELIPNIDNLIEAGEPALRPEARVLAAVAVGMTGIAWNEELTGPVESIEQLFEDPKLKGKVSMLMELADSVGLVMLANGDDPTEVTDETYSARSTGSRAPSTPARSLFTGNDFAQPLTRGASLAAAVAWSGDMIQLLADNPKLKWRCRRTA